MSCDRTWFKRKWLDWDFTCWGAMRKRKERNLRQSNYKLLYCEGAAGPEEISWGQPINPFIILNCYLTIISIIYYYFTRPYSIVRMRLFSSLNRYSLWFRLPLRIRIFSCDILARYVDTVLRPIFP